MTPERMTKLVARWVRLYTRDLPVAVARRRADEIDADLHDQIAHQRARGADDRRIALSILSRMVRGLAADASWRGEHAGALTARPAHRSALHVVLATGCVLLLPLVAMLITDEVAWGPLDFAVAGTLVAGTGLLLQAARRRADSTLHRLAAAVGLVAALMLVWASLAVGIVGAEGDPADLMYGAVLAVGFAGAVAARLRAAGMARALLAMALAQALVAAIALIAGKHQAPTSSVFEIVAVNGFFITLFLVSAGLFQRATRRHPAADAQHQPK